MAFPQIAQVIIILGMRRLTELDPVWPRLRRGRGGMGLRRDHWRGRLWVASLIADRPLVKLRLPCRRSDSDRLPVVKIASPAAAPPSASSPEHLQAFVSARGGPPRLFPLRPSDP
jgi:hypothetical protein